MSNPRKRKGDDPGDLADSDSTEWDRPEPGKRTRDKFVTQAPDGYVGELESYDEGDGHVTVYTLGTDIVLSRGDDQTPLPDKEVWRTIGPSCDGHDGITHLMGWQGGGIIRDTSAAVCSPGRGGGLDITV